jgi:hypothetical protein
MKRGGFSITDLLVGLVMRVVAVLFSVAADFTGTF